MRGYFGRFESDIGDFKPEYNHGIYRAEITGIWWLASPMGLGTDWVYHNSDGGTGRFESSQVINRNYLRPIVCMKTSIFQEKYEKSLVDE